MALQIDAASTVTDRIFADRGGTETTIGSAERDACRQNLAFLFEFLRPTLEFGILQPIVDYLRWLEGFLDARGVPVERLAQSLEWSASYFIGRMSATEGTVVCAALLSARAAFLEYRDLDSLAPPVLAGSWPEVAPFQEALLSGNHREALAVVNGCFDNRHHLIDIEMHVIRPALYNIGEKWQFNQITIAQEHLATAIAQSVMTMGLLRSRRPTPSGKRILLACVAGNNHDIGLRMVADAFLLAGWDMQFLGADVPSSALILHATQWKPDLVGLSISLPQQMRAIKEIVAQLSEQFGSGRPAVMIGGAAVNGCNRLANMTPADWQLADAPAAVISANRLVGEVGDSRKPG